MAENGGLEDGIWAVITAASGRRYVGKVADANLPECIKLRPVYEVFTPIKQTPQGMNKDVVVFPVDVCIENVGMALYNPSEVSYRGDDISEQDWHTYEGHIRNIQKELATLRAKKSGIAIPPAGFDFSKLGGSFGRGS